MCNGNDCAYFATTNCLGIVVPTTNDAGEQEALWGYEGPNLTVDGGTDFLGDISFGAEISTQAYKAIVQPKPQSKPQSQSQPQSQPPKKTIKYNKKISYF
tara:strand:+ start:340 stop:639 length:300 start_codon:yes stop_codon:yes gene_type:complete